MGGWWAQFTKESKLRDKELNSGQGASEVIITSPAGITVLGSGRRYGGRGYGGPTCMILNHGWVLADDLLVFSVSLLDSSPHFSWVSRRLTVLACIRLCGPRRICLVTKVLLADVNNYVARPSASSEGDGPLAR